MKTSAPTRTGSSNRPAAKALSAEVWLGPMEGESFTVEPAGEGSVIRIGRRRADEKRGAKNDLVLAEGDGVSGFHAEVRLAGGAIRLKDLNSTNGTFAANKRVTGEVVLQPGEIFLLSTTPLQAFLEALPAPPVPSEADLSASAPFLKMLVAARGSASRHRDAFVDTRHLLDALARSRNAAVGKALEDAGLTGETLLERLWSGRLFEGGHEWLRRFLAPQSEIAAPAGAPGGEPPLSLRVREIFGKARARLAGYGGAEAEQGAAGALLTALHQAARGPVSTWLKELGVEPVALPAERRPTQRKTARVAKAAAQPPPAAEETARKDAPEVTAWRPSRDLDGEAAIEAAVAAAARPQPGAAAPPMPVYTTGDVVLDRRARAIAAELEEASVVYRFSTPEDRRAVLKAVVEKALASVAPGNRTSIVNQIRLQFPIADVPQPPAPAEDTSRLKARIRELEKQIGDLRASGREKSEKREAPSAAVDWRALLAEEPPAGRRADANVAALREMVAFVRRIERFVMGIVQGVTMPGSATMTFKLPGQRYTLGSIFSQLEQGREPDARGLADYLHDLERWQVAVLAGHHESGRIWFERFWKKVAPAAIEAAAAKSGGWKLGGGGADLWNRYKDAVEGLSPDVAQDQVLKAAYRFAQEEFERMTKGRSG